ncbi:MAG TPA: M28 family peptidase [Vicinamibacterales bacterium]
MRRSIVLLALAALPMTAASQQLLEWPLPPTGQAYADIDGRHLHAYVVEQAAISRRYRDQGHPQFWGRITGTSSDTESAEWLAGHLKRIGLTDVRVQPIELPPQWMPQSWTISASSRATALQLDRSATPAYGTPGTSGAGLDVEAVWVGTGSEADFAGRDVLGKAVFMFSMPLPGSMNNTSTFEGGPKRAEEKGAAAVFEIIALPGNMRNVLYPARVNVPVFTLGMEDGYAIRDLIGNAGSRPPHVRIRLDVSQVPNEASALVWGTLPGATDETIYVMAHRDGWFDAATDNASGVATMIGLAEHFAKVPRARRRRTIVFVGLDGHHNDSGGVGRMWMADHREQLFLKTALAINAEHTSTIQTYFYGERIRHTNMYTAQLWYAGGPTRPKLQDLAIRAFREFGVPIYSEPESAPPPGDLGRFFRFVPGVDAGDFNMYFHTDGETPETVPWTGLQASTRAYARIIDGVNELDLEDLQRPPEPEPRTGRQ